MDMKNGLSRLLFPLTYKQVFSVSWRYHELFEKTQWHSKEELIHFQWEKIKRILYHAYESVPIYRYILDAERIHPEDIKSEDDFKKLPIITKNDFINFGKEKCTSFKIPRKRIIYQSTSGSTGSPFEYGADRFELGIRHLMQFRSYEWAGWRIGDKCVYFDGMMGNAGINPLLYTAYRTYYNFIARRLHIFSPQINSDAGMMKILSKVKQYNPKLIRATVSQIRLILRFIKKNNFDFIRVPIITVGETLTQKDREDIDKILGCEVFESYGAGEFCGAYECDQHNGLHIACENVYLEIIKNGKKASDGKQGRIIITNLNNYVWPFIRYDIGDLGILSNKICKCGRNLPLLKEVSGRRSEFIVTSDDKLLGVHDFTQIIGQNFDYIKQWQITQKKKGEVTALIVPTERMTNEVKNKIVQNIRDSANNKLDVNIRLVEDIPLGRTDKRQLIKSNVKLNI